MGAPFFITGLPRSRTAWLANLLTHGGGLCLHEGLLRGIDALIGWLQAGTDEAPRGDSDSGLAMVWPEIAPHFPGARLVIVRRSLEEARASYRAFIEHSGMPWSAELEEALAGCAKLLDEMAVSTPHIAVDFADLENDDTLRQVWEYCRPDTPFPAERVAILRDLNVQQDLRSVLRLPGEEFLESILPYCRPHPASERLWRAVWRAHQGSASHNQNMSKVAAAIAGQGSGSFAHAACGAMMTLGERHGPIAAARRALRTLDFDRAKAAALAGERIPGFGNSFFKDGIDPEWSEVDVLLASEFPAEYRQLAEINRALWAAGKRVYPNPAGFSAAACEACGLPLGVEDGVFVLPRIYVWWSDFLKTL